MLLYLIYPFYFKQTTHRNIKRTNKEALKMLNTHQQFGFLASTSAVGLGSQQNQITSQHTA